MQLTHPYVASHERVLSHQCLNQLDHFNIVYPDLSGQMDLAGCKIVLPGR